MTPHPHLRPAAAALLLILAALAPLGLGACARTPDITPAAEGAPFSPDDALARAITREQRRPSTAARNAPPPPDLDATDLQPIPAEDLPRARLDTQAALDEVARHFPETPDLPALDIPDDDRRRAQILYTRARALRLDGAYQDAIETLEEAARLDPDAAEPWREIGEARLALNDRHGAGIAFRRAFDRAPDDPRILEQIASLPGDDFSDRQTAALLARLLDARADDADPALQYLVPARLGAAMLNLGYLSAGVELLQKAVQLPDRFGTPSNRGQQLASLYRRRGDLWTTIGDAHMRLQNYERAIDAYQNASRFPSLDPSGLLLRRVYAAMRLGRPATAASFLLDRMAGAGARPDDAILDALRYVAEYSSIADDLDNAILALQASLTHAERELARGSIVRARAAVLPPDRAVTILREHLADHPADNVVLSGLFDRLAAESNDAAIRQAIRLSDDAPLRSRRFADALLRAIPDPIALLDAWDAIDDATRQSPNARLLHANLLAAAKRPAAADHVLQLLLEDQPGYPPALIARVRLLEVLDRGPEADALLRSIDPAADIDLAYAKALALAERQAIADARAVIRATLDVAPPDHPRRPDLLLLAAQLAAADDDPTGAEQRYLEVLELRPASEQAHAGLIRLYAKSAPLENEKKLVDQIARLREANPASRLLRTLRAREALARGQFDLAERDLLDLAEQFPDDEQAIDALVQLWLQINSHERAERWLRRQIERFPARSVYQVHLAQVHIDQRRFEEAAHILQAWLDQYPGDVRVSRLLEELYRQALGENEAANILELRRLENTGDPGATAARRAELYLRNADYDKLARAIPQAIEHAEKRGDDITAWATDFAEELNLRALIGAVDVERALDAIGALCDSIDTLPQEVHLDRLELLGYTALPFERMVPALERAAQQHPELRVEGTRRLAAALAGPHVVETVPRPQRSRDGIRRARRNATHPETLLRMNNAVSVLRHFPLDTFQGKARATILATAYIVLISADPEVLPELRHTDWIVDNIVDTPNKDALIEEIYDKYTAAGQRSTKAPPPQERSVMASSVAVALSNVGRDRDADIFDELALDYDPNNQNSNNNYGYRLLERNEPETLDKAVRLIERAYEANAPSPPVHVIDSLGWARYKAGVIHDVLDPEGNLVTEGAVTLLKRAVKRVGDPRVSLDAAVNSPILANHLADALWAAGDREQAIDHWRDAVRLGREALGKQIDIGYGQSTSEELQRTVKAASAKLDAALNDRSPSIAPILRPVNAPGAPAAPDEPDADAAPPEPAPQPETIPQPQPAGDPG